MDIAAVLEEYLADLTTLPGDLAFVLDEIKVKDEKLLEAQKRLHQRDSLIQKYVKINGAMQECPKEQALYPRIRSDFQDCISLQQDKIKLAIMGLYLVTKHVNTLDNHVARLEAEGQLAPVVSELDDPVSNSSISPEPFPKVNKRSMSETASRRASRPESSHDKAHVLSDPKLASHSRSSSTTAAPTLDSTKSQRLQVPTTSSSGSVSTSDLGNEEKSSVQSSSPDESQRQALEVNGARLSLKRNHQSPRQRPLGLEERDEAFCYCKKGSVGNMIACDGDSCEIEWFHWECVGLIEDPKGSWYCPECKEKIKKQAR